MKVTRRGEFVSVTYEGRALPAMVGLASENGESVILLFEGMLGGYVGSMPIAWRANGYVDLLIGHPVRIAPSS